MPHYYETFSDLKKLVRVHGEAVAHLLRKERRLRSELGVVEIHQNGEPPTSSP